MEHITCSLQPIRVCKAGEHGSGTMPTKLPSLLLCCRRGAIARYARWL